jgi:hypothetical protein
MAIFPFFVVKNTNQSNAALSKTACRGDQVSFRPFWFDVSVESCSYVSTDAAKTAKSTGTGASSRIGDAPPARWVHRQLYLGKINGSQHEAWGRLIKTFDADEGRRRQLALFPADRELPDHAQGHGVQVRLDAWRCIGRGNGARAGSRVNCTRSSNSTASGAGRLSDSREGTPWQHTLQTLVCYRLIDPGSEWRLHRQRL